MTNNNLLSRRLLYDRKLSQWLQSYVQEYVHDSVSGQLKFDVNKFSCFVNYSVVLSMIVCKSNLRTFWCNLRDAKIKEYFQEWLI